MKSYTVWFGSVAPSNDQRWWVLDDEAEAKWGWLAKPAAGPFATVEAAEAAKEGIEYAEYQVAVAP